MVDLSSSSKEVVMAEDVMMAVSLVVVVLVPVRPSTLNSVTASVEEGEACRISKLLRVVY